MEARVVVGEAAASLALQFLTGAQGLSTALAQVSATSDTLAKDTVWDGATAQQFRAERHTMAARLQAMDAAVQRMARGAQSVIGAIDRADALGATPSAHIMTPMTPPMTPVGSGPIQGWDYTDGVPTVDATGAYQPDHGKDYGKDKNGPFGDPSVTGGLMTWAETIAFFSHFNPGNDAADFFQHYLDGTGSDKLYNSMAPYQASPYFAANVNRDAAAGIRKADAARQNTFDSGYIYNADQFKGNADWTGAVKGCFRRVTGVRNPDGTWTVTVQITSLYQFVPGKDFGPGGLANGALLHQLERDGVAKNYHSIGTGKLLYDGSGKVIRVLTPPQ